MSATETRASPEGPARNVETPAQVTERDSVCTVAQGADIRAAAIAAAERWGFYVFPIPPLHKAAKGWPDWPNRNSNDPAMLAGHWPSPRHNYGIACKRSGLVVLDLDVTGPDDIGRHFGVPEGARRLAERCCETGHDWPDTLTIVTPRGGWHLIFRAIIGRPVGNSAGKLGEHIDIRGGGNSGGGYIVGPGSVIDQRAYDKPVTLINGGRYIVSDDLPIVPLPDWIAGLLDPSPEQRDRPAAPVVPIGNGAGRYADKALVGEIDRVLSARAGSRNHTLNRAAFSLGQLVAGDHLDRAVVMTALHQAGESIGLSDAEVRRTVASGMESGAKQPRRAS